MPLNRPELFMMYCGIKNISILSVLAGLLLFGCTFKQDKNPKKVVKYVYVGKGKEKTNEEFQNGDLIFQTSLSNQSHAIQIATNSIYSHMGVIYKEGDQVYVYEAIQPVQMTKLTDWIKRGKDGKYVLKRLKNSDEILTSEGVERMRRVGGEFLGKQYDMQFEWSDEKIYCSELVWKIYKESFNIEIGQLQKIKDFDLDNDVVKAKLNERYGDDIPMEEFVITPDRMFKAENLKTIIEK